VLPDLRYALQQRYKSIAAVYPVERLSAPPPNHIGYALPRAQNVQDAVKVFQLETESFPKDWNAFDSLGEAYEKAGQRQFALQAYKRSVELNTKNANGVTMIQKLEQ
jgi:Flp pilus assembly protein TadD